MKNVNLILGDCLEEMPKLEANSVDTIVTDPPYGLDFMGKDWDHGVPGITFWKEALRIAKPGAMLFAFGGTRTVHRLACAIEDAGWMLRDRIAWVYGSGFPKSHNISKAIDKRAGAEREVVGISDNTRDRSNHVVNAMNKIPNNPILLTVPATNDAELWDGYGTALKPAHEPIIVAMKPIEGTFAENALKWGVAGLWIDGGRVPTDDNYTINTWDNGAKPFGDGAGNPYTSRKETQGRWPANLVHDGSDEVKEEFPNSTSRFFYCAKASKSERNKGLDGMELIPGGSNAKGYTRDVANGLDRNRPVANYHPTVKPIELMRYLCRLSRTPSGGVILDPFMGSGSTGIAALMEGRSFIGIEMDEGYLEIAKNRISEEI